MKIGDAVTGQIDTLSLGEKLFRILKDVETNTAYAALRIASALIEEEASKCAISSPHEQSPEVPLSSSAGLR